MVAVVPEDDGWTSRWAYDHAPPGGGLVDATHEAGHRKGFVDLYDALDWAAAEIQKHHHAQAEATASDEKTPDELDVTLAEYGF